MSLWSNTAPTYTVMSDASKPGAMCVMYPYQPICLRIQVRSLLRGRTVLMRCRSNGAGELASLYDHVDHRPYIDTWGRVFAVFYHGLTTNLVRVPPGTCAIFVVYENVDRLFKRAVGSAFIEEGLMVLLNAWHRTTLAASSQGSCLKGVGLTRGEQQ